MIHVPTLSLTFTGPIESPFDRPHSTQSASTTRPAKGCGVSVTPSASAGPSAIQANPASLYRATDLPQVER